MKSLFRRVILSNNISFSRVNIFRLASSDTTKQAQEPQKAEEVINNITVEKYGGVTTLNIDRQKTRNSLNEGTLREIAAAVDAFDKDPEAKVLVFNGEGGSFCSGFDLDEIGAKGYNTLLDAASRLLRRPLCDKPTIAAVTGYAVAEGFELALACDLRVIEDTAVIGCLGRRFGVPQSLYGARRLTSLIGLSRALDLLMTGRLINGTEAYAMGFACKLTATGTGKRIVTHLMVSDHRRPWTPVTPEELQERCRLFMLAVGPLLEALGESVKLAKSLTKFPQNALMMDKLAAVNSQLNPNSEESMRDEAVIASLLGGAIQDMNEGVAKFQKGIGKHGKFYRLTEVPLKDWELEESVEEVTVETDKPKKC